MAQSRPLILNEWPRLRELQRTSIPLKPLKLTLDFHRRKRVAEISIALNDIILSPKRNYCHQQDYTSRCNEFGEPSGLTILLYT